MSRTQEKDQGRSGEPKLTEEQVADMADRDPRGLQKTKKDGPHDEAHTVKKAKAMYLKMLHVVVPLISQACAWGTYLVLAYGPGPLSTFSNAFRAQSAAKFAFLREHDLGWVYLAVWITAQARARLVVNANAMRAGARVGRPDQHAYIAMDVAAAKPEESAPLVLMANTGAVGRFNRAQRGVFNTDEGMPLFLANVVLSGCVFGPVVVVLALLAGYGRIKFALGYTEGTDKRTAGFLPALVAETWAAGLVLLIAIKTLAGERIPF